LYLQACGSTQPPPRSTKPPSAVLLPVDTLKRNFALRQRISIRWGKKEEHFEAVLEKQGAKLTLLALGPMGTVGFAITHTTRSVSVENRTGRRLPFSPHFIIADIQRVFYPWLGANPDCARCERSQQLSTTFVKERFENNHLIERHFMSSEPTHRTAITYHDWNNATLAPKRVILNNPGYQLTVETLNPQ